MWLSNSSVGRKFVMALSGAVLVLFVTFHCLMNSVAICWPEAYNMICEFLGANWYALVASAGLALFILIHIIYAVMLTVQNYKARGTKRYAMSVRPRQVEWSSKNMLVLGIVILCFLVVHLIQFWAKMQLVEVMGCEETIPAAAGTLFIQEAFSQPWTVVVYIIGFIALWFHFNHGFWSMFQSIGWNNTNWMPRLKCIAAWWTSIVVLLFVAQAIVFTVNANNKYYLKNAELRDQYKDMLAPMLEKEMGPKGAMFADQVKMLPYEQVTLGIRQTAAGMKQSLEQYDSPEGKEVLKKYPEAKEEVETTKKEYAALERCIALFEYLEASDDKPETQQFPGMPGGAQPY